MKAHTLGAACLRVDDVLAVVNGTLQLRVAAEGPARDRITKTARIVAERVLRGETIYGVNTGFGDSCANAISESHQQALARNLVRFHGCATGALLSFEEATAVVAVRAAALARGYSGVRIELLEAMCALLNARIAPAIPCEGSVGASGDLTPLSYLAALLMGERSALLPDGSLLPGKEAVRRSEREPLALQPKESLALMNGTSVMTGLGCIAIARAQSIAHTACAITALMSAAMQGEPGHFDERICAAKPHPGQTLAARWIREALRGSGKATPLRIQDRYSIRCAPQVVGVLIDAIVEARRIHEIEINGANDNPLIDPESGEVLHGGNFYGGHVAHAMEMIKTQVANVADLLDRQLALVCNHSTNNGLPANLVAVTGSAATSHHGFKAMQISASALTAEALKLTVPASVFSRSTENHNQDKVSMGTIAARDALRICELTERVAAIALLGACQALELRNPDSADGLLRRVREVSEFNRADREYDREIAVLATAIRNNALGCGNWESP